MKRVTIVFIAIILASFSLQEKNIEEFQSNIVLKSAYIFWEGANPFTTHRGTVKLKSGYLTIVNSQLLSGKFVVDMTTIHNREGHKKLEKHLKSANFFEVEKYPTATFVITNVVQKHNKVQITGDVTIKGITKQVSVNGVILENDKAYIVRSEVFKLNRAEFNVKYMSKSFFKNLRDKFINDDVNMSFSLKILK